jgi:hypothetical protein
VTVARCRVLLLALSAVAASWPSGAAAQVDHSPRSHPGGLAAPAHRPVGIAEVGVGWLTLPGAEVCAGGGSSCEQGDTSLELEMWQLYRANLLFAFGAGITLGLVPTTDAPARDAAPVAGQEPITRDHSRGYFTVEAIGRYYPFVGENLEWWVGTTFGLVVVSDSYTSNQRESDYALVGPRAQTIRTEGYTVGLATGVAYSIAPNWSLGASLRYGSWFLPELAASNPLGDGASLNGQNNLFAFGINVAYRIAL